MAWKRLWKVALPVCALFSAYAMTTSWFVADRLLLHLESEFAQLNPLDSGEFDLVITLGGETRRSPNGLAQTSNAGGGRVLLAARMYHRGLVERLVCSGKSLEGLSVEGDGPTRQTEEIWRDLGIPGTQITQIEGRNTSEEMAEIANLLEQSPGARVGLITSACHMKRAMRLARAAGIELEPLPAGFMSTERVVTILKELRVASVELREVGNAWPIGGRGLVRFSADWLSTPMDAQAENLYLTPSQVCRTLGASCELRGKKVDAGSVVGESVVGGSVIGGSVSR